VKPVRQFPAALVLLGLVGWLGCGEETVEPELLPVVEVSVTPAGTSLSGVGATTTFDAVALDANGDTIAGSEITWSSLNPSVATMQESGTATAVASGQVTIAAEADGETGYALLTVSVPDVDPIASWTVEVPPAIPLYHVWGTSPTDVYAVGEDGAILHYDGTDWSAELSPTSDEFLTLWGTSSTDIYAVCRSGVIWHFEGDRWIPVSQWVDWVESFEKCVGCVTERRLRGGPPGLDRALRWLGVVVCGQRDDERPRGGVGHVVERRLRGGMGWHDPALRWDRMERDVQRDD
jgi:hypothetical protein